MNEGDAAGGAAEANDDDKADADAGGEARLIDDEEEV